MQTTQTPAAPGRRAESCPAPSCARVRLDQAAAVALHASARELARQLGLPDGAIAPAHPREAFRLDPSGDLVLVMDAPACDDELTVRIPSGAWRLLREQTGPAAARPSHGGRAA